MRALSIAVGLVLGLLPGCSCDGGGAGRAPADGDVVEVEYELFETTQAFEPEELDALVSVSADGAVFEFAAPVPERAAGLRSRDVIVGGVSAATPKGFLRVVHHTEPAPGGGLRVITQPTSLAYAFRHLDLHVRKTVEVTPEELGREEGSLRQPIEVGAPVGFDTLVFDGDRDPSTTDDQIHVAGRVDPTVRFDLDVDLDWPDSVWDIIVPIDDPMDLLDPTSILPDASVTIDATARVDASLGMAGVAGLDFEKVLDFGHYPLGAYPAVPPFLVFVVSLDIEGKMTGGASSSFSLGTSGSTGEFGVHVCVSSDDDEPSAFDVIRPTPSFAVDTPVIDARANAELRVGPKIGMLLWDLAGPRIGLATYARLEADNLREPCWTLDTGLEGNVGIHIAGIVDKTWDVPIAETRLADGGCRLPPEAGTDTLPTFTPWARSYSDIGYASGEWTELVPVTDGRLVIASDMGQALAKVTADGDLVWTRTYDRIEPGSALRSRLYTQRAAPTRDADIVLLGHPSTLLRLDQAGGVRWARKTRVVEHGSLLPNGGVVELADGTLLFVASYQAEDGGEQDVALVRVSPTGEFLDARRWGDPGQAEIPAGLAPWAGGFVVVGRSQADGPASAHGWALVLDGAGGLSRAFVFDGGDRDVELRAARALDDGGLLVGGMVSRPGGYNGLLVKLRADGSPAWQRTYRASDGFGVVVTSVDQSPLGYLLVAGTSRSYFDGTWLAALDTAGYVDWSRLVHADGNAFSAPALLVNERHGVLVAAQQAVTDEDGLALFEVWRKDGLVPFRSGVGVVEGDLGIADGDAGIAMEDRAAPATAPISLPWEQVTVEVAAPAPAEVGVLAP